MGTYHYRPWLKTEAQMDAEASAADRAYQLERERDAAITDGYDRVHELNAEIDRLTHPNPTLTQSDEEGCGAVIGALRER